VAVLLERRDRIATLTLDRPPLNILDIPTLQELAQALGSLREEPDLHLVVLRGSGERAFSAGVAVEDHVPEKIEAMLETFHGALKQLRDLPALTLAVVRGHCLGGGLELATCCDLLVAAEDASFGLPEVELGCFPPVAAALYPRRLGTGRTLELLLTGRRFDGREALRLGLATWIAAADGLEERAQELITDLSSRSAAVARLIKRAVRAGDEQVFPAALASAEALYLQELAATEDMREGLDAFRERRSPVWKHR